MEVEFDSWAPLVEAVCHGIPLRGILVDGGARVNVMIVSTMENMGLQCDRQSKCNLRMANKEKVKPKGVIIAVNISVLKITTTLHFQVIRSEIGAYPMILGWLCLKRAHASNYWKEGFMTIGVLPNRRRVFVDGRKILKFENFYLEYVTSNVEESTMKIEVDTNNSSSENDVDLYASEVVPNSQEGSSPNVIVRDEKEIDKTISPISLGNGLMNKEINEF